MSRFWKALVGLAVVLPLSAYVAGTLASADEQPAPRPPIIIEDDEARPTDGPSRTPTPDGPPSRSTGDDAEDDGDDRHVITPRPSHRDEPDGDDRGSGGGRDDDSAPDGDNDGDDDEDDGGDDDGGDDRGDDD